MFLIHFVSICIAVFGIIGRSLLGALAAEVTCYAPDGVTIAPNDSYVPCNKLGITQQGIYSSCCALDGDPDSRDLCTASGLCLRDGIVRREYCTDPQWQSPACVAVCMDPKWGGSRNGSVELTPCTDGTYCCGRNNLTCCGTEYAVTVHSQTSIVVVQTATVTASPSGIPSVASMAGLGAALGAATLVFAGISIWLFSRNIVSKRRARYVSGSMTQPGVHTFPPSSEPRPMSYIPGSGAVTVGNPSSHVPSMQDFAAFKAMYPNLAPTGTATEVESNPRNYPELDTAAMASPGSPSHPGMVRENGTEQIHEIMIERDVPRGAYAPTGGMLSPNAPSHGA